jgi:uncharacterized Ntn-hydrolase superfamily protein
MTFSLVARCDRTGMLGVAVSSSSAAVAARCAHAREGAGAVASQNITDPTLGHLGLDLMKGGLSADQALKRLREVGHHIEFRQLLLVDQQGGTAAFSGRRTLGLHATRQRHGVAAAGNLLASEDVPAHMVEAFERSEGQHLGDRLVAAMQAGLKAGGEAGPLHSAGLLVVSDVAWPVADLRIDWTEGDPIAELARLWDLWKPQMDDYVTRALDPASAPAYGVAGDP